MSFHASLKIHVLTSMLLKKKNPNANCNLLDFVGKSR